MSLYKNLMTYSTITMLKAAQNSNLLATCNSNSALQIYNLSRMQKVQSYYHSTRQIQSIAFSKAGLFASSCDDSTIKVWSLSSSVSSYSSDSGGH